MKLLSWVPGDLGHRDGPGIPFGLQLAWDYWAFTEAVCVQQGTTPLVNEQTAWSLNTFSKISQPLRGTIDVEAQVFLSLNKEFFPLLKGNFGLHCPIGILRIKLELP